MLHPIVTVCWKFMLLSDIIHSPRLERLQSFNHITVELIRLIVADDYQLKLVVDKFL